MVHFFHAPLADAAKYRKKHEEVRQIMSRIKSDRKLFQITCNDALGRAWCICTWGSALSPSRGPDRAPGSSHPWRCFFGTIPWRKDGKKIWKKSNVKNCTRQKKCRLPVNKQGKIHPTLTGSVMTARRWATTAKRPAHWKVLRWLWQSKWRPGGSRKKWWRRSRRIPHKPGGAMWIWHKQFRSYQRKRKMKQRI